jgi:hypothetical protein
VVLWTLQGIVAFAVPPRVDRGVRQASGKLGDVITGTKNNNFLLVRPL